jgi:hypothetical protein
MARRGDVTPRVIYLTTCDDDVFFFDSGRSVTHLDSQQGSDVVAIET